MHLPQLLRVRYQLGLSVLPMGLPFSSFFVLKPFSAWLSEYLEIPEGVPVKDQPNGILWIVLFLSSTVVLLILGYLIGWVLNAIIARTVLGWDPEKTRRVFLYSEVPNEWLKEGVISNGTKKERKKASIVNEKWAEIRKMGKWNFILTRGVYRWGSSMYFFMVIVPALLHGSHREKHSFFLGAVLMGAGGAIFGAIFWHFSEKQYLQASKKEKPEE